MKTHGDKSLCRMIVTMALAFLLCWSPYAVVCLGKIVGASPTSASSSNSSSSNSTATAAPYR